jgi:hypothetical protein
MKVILASIIITFLFCCCNCQSVSRIKIDGLIKAREPDIKFSEMSFYIVNGVPYDSIKVDSVLHKFCLKELVDISLFKNKDLKPVVFHNPDKWVANITLRYKQNRKNIISNLNVAKEMFNNGSTDVPELFIDDKQIPEQSASLELKKLNPKNVYFIFLSQPEKNSSFYSEKKKSDVVKIWNK